MIFKKAIALRESTSLLSIGRYAWPYLLPEHKSILDKSNREKKGTYAITCGTSIEWEDARLRSPAISASLAKSVSWSASRALLRDSSNLISSMRLVRLIVPCNKNQRNLEIKFRDQFRLDDFFSFSVIYNSHIYYPLMYICKCFLELWKIDNNRKII